MLFLYLRPLQFWTSFGFSFLLLLYMCFFFFIFLRFFFSGIILKGYKIQCVCHTYIYIIFTRIQECWIKRFGSVRYRYLVDDNNQIWDFYLEFSISYTKIYNKLFVKLCPIIPYKNNSSCSIYEYICIST